MQTLPKGPGRRRSDRTPPSHAAVPPLSVDDSVAAIVDQFGLLDTSAVTVPAASASPSSLPHVDSATEAPAMTRRELREREAREAASRPLLFPAESRRPAASRVDASAPASPVESALATNDAVRETMETDVAEPRRAKVTRRAARRAAAGPDPRRPGARAGARRAATIARSTRPVGKPRVAATVTASADRPVGRIASAKRRILSQLVTVGAMAGVGLILVATTVPANAFSRPDAAAQTSAVSEAASSDAGQQLKVAAVAAPTVTRDGYSVISEKQLTAARYGNQLMLYSNDPNGTIQWPFPTGVPITSGFGARKVAGCGFCSTNHMGVDFTPGAGTPIQAIADGTVSLVEVSNAGLGNHVVIDHVINGQKVQSVYGHMQYGSIKVAEGQHVTVGQQVGAVGSTGASTGAHLHLEVHLDGVPVDPFAWLKANAN